MCKNADFFCQNSPQKAHNNILVCRFRLFQITDSLSGSQMRREEVQLAPYSNWGHSQLQTRSETSPAWMFPTQVVAGAEYTCNRWLPANACVRVCVCVTTRLYFSFFPANTPDLSCRTESVIWMMRAGNLLFCRRKSLHISILSDSDTAFTSRIFYLLFFSFYRGCVRTIRQTDT